MIISACRPIERDCGPQGPHFVGVLPILSCPEALGPTPPSAFVQLVRVKALKDCKSPTLPRAIAAAAPCPRNGCPARTIHLRSCCSRVTTQTCGALRIGGRYILTQECRQLLIRLSESSCIPLLQYFSSSDDDSAPKKKNFRIQTHSQ